jgi:hypothetical protein
VVRYALRAFGSPMLINDGGGYMVLISGKPVFVIAGSLNMETTIGRRSSASFVVRTAIPTQFQQYQQVKIYDQTTRLVFSGYISNPNTAPDGFRGSLIHSLSCIDRHFLADKRSVQASYVNKTCGFIVQDIARNVLAAEGVTIAQIYDGLTPSTALYPGPALYPGGNVGLIPEANFSYCKVSEAFDALVTQASASGVPYYWQIDELKRLWFVPYTAVVNSTLVDGTQIDDTFNPPRITRQNPLYRNSQTVTGGVQQTVLQDETRKGDGNTTAWPMNFDLSTVPTITVNGAARTVGINGVQTGKDFYWNKGDRVVSQDSGAAKLTSSDTLRVRYVGQYPSVVITQDGAQIDYQRSIDGSSGIIENVKNDATQVSNTNSLSLASQLLTRYGAQGVQLEFSTRQAGFAQGQLITVNLPLFGLNDTQMLIDKVGAGDQQDGVNIWYRVTAIQGPYDTSWEAFFSKLLAQPQPANAINVGVTQTVTLLQQVALPVTVSMTMTGTTYACPLPSSSTFPSSSLFPC